MSETYFEEQTFENINIKDGRFIKGHYEFCSFVNCDLSNGDLPACQFTE